MFRLTAMQHPLCDLARGQSAMAVHRHRHREQVQGLPERRPAIAAAAAAAEGRSEMAVARDCSTPLVGRYPPQFMPPTSWGEVLLAGMELEASDGLGAGCYTGDI